MDLQLLVDAEILCLERLISEGDVVTVQAGDGVIRRRQALLGSRCAVRRKTQIRTVGAKMTLSSKNTTSRKSTYDIYYHLKFFTVGRRHFCQTLKSPAIS